MHSPKPGIFFTSGLIALADYWLKLHVILKHVPLISTTRW